MRILYILPALQHPSLRGPTRHYHFIRELSRRHAITLLALTRVPISSEASDEMASYVDKVFTFGSGWAPNPQQNGHGGVVPYVRTKVQQMTWLRRQVAEMKATFDRLVRQQRFDVVLFHGKSVFPVIEGFRDLPIVVDFCDATSFRIRSSLRSAGVLKSPLLAWRYFQVRVTESQLVRKTPYRAFISCRDRAAVLGPFDRSEILPNGVDLDYWTRRSHDVDANSVVFTGVMDYAPNVDAAFYLIEKILPRVRQSLPEVKVSIVGRDPPPPLVERARQDPHVTVTGFVPDMRPYLERAAVCAAPLRYASGVQNKALEAMAMELPLVATPTVADGLRVDGSAPLPVAVAEGEAEFADQLVRLLKDEHQRQRLAAEGRRFIAEHFVWSRNARKLEELCEAAVASHLPARRTTTNPTSPACVGSEAR